MSMKYSVAKELHRIAELMKLELWLKMESDQTTTRQKGILTSVIKEL